MKTLTFKSGILVFLAIVAAVVIAITTDQSFSLQSVSDILFMIALGMLLIGAALHVVQTGFFDGIVYSFKRYFRNTAKRQMIEEDHSEIKYQLDYDNPITYPLLIAGAFCTIITVIISVALIQ